MRDGTASMGLASRPRESVAFFGSAVSFMILVHLSISMIPEHLAPIQEDTIVAVNYVYIIQVNVCLVDGKFCVPKVRHVIHEKRWRRVIVQRGCSDRMQTGRQEDGRCTICRCTHAPSLLQGGY